MEEMKMKIGDLLQKKESLVRVLQAELPIKAAYRLSRTAKFVNEELTEYDRLRNELIKKYGKKDEKGSISIEPETKEMATFMKELNQILNEEVDLKVMKVDFEMLGDEVKLTAMDLLNLEDFINFNEEDLEKVAEEVEEVKTEDKKGE